jgi:hypothetical protein
MVISVVHPGHHLIVPYQQGGLDGLCGLYAGINAIRVVYAPEHRLSSHISRELFATGIIALMARGRSRANLYRGMTAEEQYALIRALLTSPVLAGRPQLRLLEHQTKRKRAKDFNLFIREEINRQAVVLVGLEGRMSHHTVVTGVSAHRVLLSDSIGMQFVRAGNFVVANRTNATLVIGAMASLSI